MRPQRAQSAFRVALGAARYWAEARKAVRPADRARRASRRASSICLFHLPTGFVDRRNQPKLSEVKPDTVVTVAVTIERHRPPPPNRPRAPYNIEASDDTNTLTITYFNARKDYLRKALARGRAALRLGHGDVLRRPFADAASRPRRRCRGLCQPAAASIRSIRSPKGCTRTRCARPWILRSSACRCCRNGRTRPGFRATTILNSAMRCAPSIVRNSPTISRRKARPGRGSLMTNCWRASSRLHCCAPICARAPAAAAPPRAGCARASSRRCPIR